MRLVIVTGLSGAGKSHALRIMEDLDFFCVDNLPPLLIGTLVGLCRKEGMERVAIGADIRGGRFFGDINRSLVDLKDYGIEYELLYLDATNETLIKRYKETRRNHPLAAMGSLSDAIAEERRELSALRDSANLLIDTSQLLPKQLRERLNAVFAEGSAAGFRVSLVTFGFKRGIPPEADFVYDVRFIPNPFYVEGLRDKTGQDKEVRDFVMAYEGAQVFCDSVVTQLLAVIPMYRKEARNELVVAVGCTGGQHRSVAMAECFQEKLLKAGYTATISHRDMTRERESR